MRECCKGDDESQRERGKFDPPPPKNLFTDGHQNLCTSGISTTMQKFIQIDLGVSVLRMRDFAPLGTKWLGYFFGGSWERLQPRRVHRFWRKIRQTTRFRARKCLLGSRNQNLRLRPPFSPKTAIFGPHFWQNFFVENGFNIGPLESKRPLIVVVAR